MRRICIEKRGLSRVVRRGLYMNVLPLFSSPVTTDMYELDRDEIELIKREPFHSHTYDLDGLSTDDRNILTKTPNLFHVVHSHIKKSLYDNLKIVDNIGYKVTSSWLNNHPPRHSAHGHSHVNSMFTGVLYVDCPQDSGELIFVMPYTTPTWNTGTIQPEVKEHNIFNSREWRLPTPTGMCILFPSHLRHGVTTNESGRNRYSIGFNIMLEGHIGVSDETINIRLL